MNDNDTLTAGAEIPARSLDQWLDYLEAIHPQEIELGLSRVQHVFGQLALDLSASQIVTVAGTNGKGTTCALIESLCLAAGQTTAVYSSPHLLDYRERVRINNQLLAAEAHCYAFTKVEQARGDTPLTFFEFSTLAALVLIAEAKVDTVLLEVGLGGRLDAVNIVDADIAVITGIALDHQDWLGDTREKIGFEKAGILRPGITAVIGDPQPPASVEAQVETLKCNAVWQGREFGYNVASDKVWHWQSNQLQLNNLPIPQVPLQNASTALAVAQQLDLALVKSQIITTLTQLSVVGRGQIIRQQPCVMLDVAHNPQATGYLCQQINQAHYRQLHLVVAMLADKDIEGSLAPLLDLQANWYVSGLPVDRSADSERLKPFLAGQQKVIDCPSVANALSCALNDAEKDDLIVVFGSFYTVAEVLKSDL